MNEQNLVSIMVNVKGKNRREMENNIKKGDFEFISIDRIIYNVEEIKQKLAGLEPGNANDRQLLLTELDKARIAAFESAQV